MPNLKLQASRALQVIPSDFADIPSPNLVLSGTVTSLGGATIIDNNNKFIDIDSSGNTINIVNVGDIVYCRATFRSATVIQVVDENTLIMNDNAVFVGDAYEIYQNSPASGYGNGDGCVLYIGTGGDMSVQLISNDIVSFKGVPSGTFFPVNVKKIFITDTDATDIVALW